MSTDLAAQLRLRESLVAGGSLGIPQLLEEATSENRRQLFRELLEVEVSFRIKRGETPTQEEYLRSFPEYADIIAAVFSSVNCDELCQGADADSEFEMTLDAADESSDELQEDYSRTFPSEVDLNGSYDLDEAPPEGNDEDVFETDFEVPGLEDETGSQVAALDEEEADDAAATLAAKQKAAKKGKTKVVVTAAEEEEAGAGTSMADFDDLAAEAEVVLQPKKRKKPAPPPAPPKVSRQAAVRYYNRMNPMRLYPLLVTVSADQLADVTNGEVDQRAGKRFDVDKSADIEITPILPGCHVYPEKQTVKAAKQKARASFWVVPHAMGDIEGKIVLRKNGQDLLDEIPLKTRVVKQTFAVVFGALAFVLPFVMSVVQFFKIDFASQAKEGFQFYTGVLNFILKTYSSEHLFLLLICCAGAAYLMFRPRRKVLFWKLGAKQETRQGFGTAIVESYQYAKQFMFAGAVLGCFFATGGYFLGEHRLSILSSIPAGLALLFGGVGVFIGLAEGASGMDAD